MARRLLLITLLLPILATAQTPDQRELKVVRSGDDLFVERASTIWSEDFAGGFPATWSIDDQSGICPWTYSMDGSWGFYNNTGGASADPGINSTTGGNGFLICDPDSANNAFYGQPSATTYQYLESSFITERIDLSAEPAVTLQFEQAYRFNNSVDMLVSISNDSISWTDWTVQGNTFNNSHSIDPELVSINISNVAGGQDTVFIKIGWDARVYYWMIDDMCIVTAPDDDIRLRDHSYDNYVEYTRFPVQQAQAFEFSSLLSNEGMNTQNNVFMQAEVLDATMTSLFTTTSPVVTFNMGDTMTVQGQTSYTPVATDTLTIAFTAHQDETDGVSSNDTVAVQLMVTDSIFARDNDMYYNEFWMDTSLSGKAALFEIGNLYEITNNDVASSVSVYVGGSTTIGAEVYASIYEVVDIPSGQFTWLGNANSYHVQASDLDDWVTLAIPSGITVQAGKQYLAMVGHPESDSALFVGRSSNVSREFTSFYKDSLVWYYTTRTPMVRLNLNFLVGLDDDHEFLGGFNMYPNPADDVVNLDLSRVPSGRYVLDILDLQGRIVSRRSIDVVQDETVQISIADISEEGVYLVRMFNWGTVYQRKLVIR